MITYHQTSILKTFLSQDQNQEMGVINGSSQSILPVTKKLKLTESLHKTGNQKLKRKSELQNKVKIKELRSLLEIPRLPTNAITD